MKPTRIFCGAAVVVAAALAAIIATGISAMGTGTTVAGPRTSAHALPIASSDIIIRPGAIHFGKDHANPPTTADCEKQEGIACYVPAQVRLAYNLYALYQQGINGTGQTIVIVDSFGSPTVGRDLTIFDRAFGLPAPPSLRVIQPAGAVPPYTPTSDRAGWAGETDLDVEYAHVVAPDANILLVETPTSENEGTSGFPQIEDAEIYVINNHLGGVISQSFSATENSFSSAQALLNLRRAYIDAAKSGNDVTVLAASGDSGAADVGPDGSTYYHFRVTSWPDSDPLVTGVGGTELHLNGAGVRISPDSAWNNTYSTVTNKYIEGDNGPNPLAGGGGRSIIFERPAYQSDVARVVGLQRGVPDISMSAACNGAVDMYQSFAGQPAGWYPTCGTSEATPMFAGIIALADQEAGQPLGLINRALYAMSAARAPGLVDITRGNNMVSFIQHGEFTTVRGWRAAPGYDLATGLGTVDAAKFVPELVQYVARSQT
jgi:subtilase family serine protease